MNRSTELLNNYNKVKDEVDSACRECGRDPSEITLIAVSKFFPASDIAVIAEQGQLDFGENRVQELLSKQAELNMLINWHLIGTLQKNKVNKVVGQVQLIHSVDNFELLQKIEQRAKQLQICQDVLLQVKMVEDKNKFGFTPQTATEVIKSFSSSTINIRGLMIISPLYDNVSESEQVFCLGEELFIDLAKIKSARSETWDCLSMGMSGDYRYALRHGATHIRIGSAIFGERYS